MEEKSMISRLLQLSLVAVLCQITNGQSDNVQPVIETKSGQIRGIEVEAAFGKKVTAYYGIPFAKPPVGNLRFKHPVKAEPWQGVLEANKMSDACHQGYLDYGPFGKILSGAQSDGDLDLGPFAKEIGNLVGAKLNESEDCLYLNIWVPTEAPNPKSLPVMVYIYGGGFVTGSASIAFYNGKNLAAQHNVIVVSMNYRVASLGFLYLKGRTDAPGNSGLMDQVMALQWVQDNIEAFGGLKKEVTVFGVSAGGASVAMHLVSPLSKNLFSKAIVQSGATASPWAILDSQEMNKRSLKLGHLSNCKNDLDRDEFMECLRSADAKDFISKDPMVAESEVTKFTYAPIVDGIFLVEDPKETLKYGRFNPAKLLIGTTKDEGTIVALKGGLIPLEYNATLTRPDFLNHIKESFKHFTAPQIEAIIHEYTDWSNVNDGDRNRDLLSEAIGDYMFHCPVQDFSSAYIKYGLEVYKYLYSYNFALFPTPPWAGVKHGDDIMTAFGMLLDFPHDPASDLIKFTKYYMKYWANFAKTGNPNEGSDDNSDLVKWNKSTPEEENYLVLDSKPKMEKGVLRVKKCAMWRELLHKLNNPKYETVSKCNCYQSPDVQQCHSSR